MLKLDKRLLTIALAELQKVPELTSDAKIYNGYLAALGPAIRQVGLVPALAVYSSSRGDGAKPKPPLLRYLQNILVEMAKPPVVAVKEDSKPVDGTPAPAAGMRNDRGVGLKVLGMIDLSGTGRQKSSGTAKVTKLRTGDAQHPAALFYYAASQSEVDAVHFQRRLEKAIVAGKLALRTLAH